MIVISDTSPIISLLKIDRLELLRDLYTQVIVPKSVYEELIANEDYSDEINKISHSTFIITKIVDNQEAVSILQRATGLHIGESEAIVLASQMKADLLLMDEPPGRAVAKEMNIEYMGIIGILSFAYKKGMLSEQEVRDCVDILRRNGRYISESLFNKLLETTTNN